MRINAQSVHRRPRGYEPSREKNNHRPRSVNQEGEDGDRCRHSRAELQAMIGGRLQDVPGGPRFCSLSPWPEKSCEGTEDPGCGRWEV